MKHNLISISLLALLAAGCSDSSGGGSSTGGNSSPVSTLTGQFVDSPVANVNYQTATQSGVTDSNGYFDYVDGETVTFSIGSITFPSVEATGYVTPLELAGTTDTNDPQVVNILRFLQTLDSDGNPSNGITISDEAKNAADVDIDFDVSESEFEANQEVVALVVNHGSNGNNLVSKSDALDHFSGTLDDVVTNKLTGTWFVADFENNENEVLMFSFLDDGSYIHTEIDQQGAGEQSGMEWGTYSISQQMLVTGHKYDDNGDTGLNDGASRTLDEVISGSGDDATITVVFESTDSIKFEFADYQNGVEVESGNLTFDRIESSGIYGSWTTDHAEDDIIVLTFFSDGTYVHNEVYLSGQEESGAEWGNYSIDSDTGKVTVSIIEDLNGSIGLSDFVTGPDEIFFSVSGDVLSVTVNEDGDSEVLTFTRL